MLSYTIYVPFPCIKFIFASAVSVVSAFAFILVSILYIFFFYSVFLHSLYFFVSSACSFFDDIFFFSLPSSVHSSYCCRLSSFSLFASFLFYFLFSFDIFVRSFVHLYILYVIFFPFSILPRFCFSRILFLPTKYLRSFSRRHCTLYEMLFTYINVFVLSICRVSNIIIILLALLQRYFLRCVEYSIWNKENSILYMIFMRSNKIEKKANKTTKKNEKIDDEEEKWNNKKQKRKIRCWVVFIVIVKKY